MKTKLFKRLGATVLALGMALSVMAIPTSAAVTTNSTADIIVTNVPENTVTANAYKIMNVTTDDIAGQPKEPVYTWVMEVANWLKNSDEYSSYIDADTNAVTDAFPGLGDEIVSTEDAAAVTSFYDDLAASGVLVAISQSIAEEADADNNVVAWTETGTDTGIYTGTFSDVAMGNYLILFTESGANNVYRPCTVNVVPTGSTEAEWTLAESFTVVPKFTTPTIDKEATNDDNGYAIGDTVNYEIQAMLPNYPENAINKTFVIYDKLSNGLSMNTNADTIKVYYSADETLDVTQDALLAFQTNYTLTIAGVNGATVTYPVVGGTSEVLTSNALSIDVNLNTLPSANGYIFVTYEATVNENAVIGANENDVILEYNNPDTGSSYKEGTTDVYTYGIKVTKVDSENTDLKLNGAEFALYKDNNGTPDTVAIEFVVVDETAGIYRLATDDDATTTTTLKTGTNGNLELRGLALGTYYLTETKAPNGYVMPSNPTTKVEIKDDKDNNADGIAEGSFQNTAAGSTVQNDTVDNDAYVSGNITNISEDEGAPSLPTTGGMGTILFTTVGLVLVGGAAILLVVMYKRKKEN